ncbi:MAG: hypothetical protein IKZ82_03960 [Clostridia bacterium]|nr:hypothetical protein [Clostridia bacterium]
MGILNKLFGAIKNAAEQAKIEIEHAANSLENAAGKLEDTIEDECVELDASMQQGRQTEQGEGGYWENIPTRENQYNSGLGYREYFEQIFRENFPEYELGFEEAANRHATVVTFTKAGAKALVVELMSEKTSAKMLRWRCENEGVPYLRFYYDHWGWWNEKRYVIDRTSKAIDK